jgi:hypothetical protein
MSLKERGVAVLLAAENAETIDRKIEITNILAEMVPSKVSRDSVFILGTNS